MGLADKSTPTRSVSEGTSLGIQSVAVLPLENIGDDPKTEFLSDGVADQIINSLSQVRRQNLKVRPFSSVSRYKGKKGDLQTIARELNVQAIVTGSLQQIGDDLAIAIELVDARENNRLWGKRYPPEKISRILDLQDQIARDVAANLRLHLTGEEEQRLTKRHTQDPEAYLLYREANFHLNKFTPEGIANSIEYCQRSIKKDPKYATAHGALARAHLLMGSLYQGPKQTFAEARKHVAQALALDANQPDALAVLATSYMFLDWDWRAAEIEFLRSIAADPSVGVTHNLYGFCLAATGRLTEALDSIQLGRQLDPLAAPRINEVAMCRIWLRQYPEAIAEANKAIELDPHFPLAYTQLATALVGQGKPDQAIVKMKAAIDAGQRHPGITGMLGYAHAVAGQTAEAQKILPQLTSLAQGRFGIAIHVARIHAALGDKVQAFEWLQKARDERDPHAIWLKVDPTFDSLRSDPRFGEILQEMRLADNPTPTRRASEGLSQTRSVSEGPTPTRSASEALTQTRSVSEGPYQPIDTLAVLPFDNQSPDPEAGYLGDDITYSLTDSLARIRELKVRPYSSAARFKATTIDAKAAGRELQVQAVLKGAIQKRGEEIVIDVELIHVGEDRRLWGDRYPGKLAERLSLQQKIIQEVPEKLRLSLTGQEKLALAKLPTPSLKAHELYIQGRLEWNKRTVQGLEKSMDLYRQAIDQDPKFALALAGLAEAYFVYPINTDSPPKDSMLKAKAAALKALEIDDQLVEAHTTLGAIAGAYEWDWAEADRRFQRAVAINPNNQFARYRYGQHLTTLGRFQEAQVHSARARELDPLTLIIRAVTGRHFYYARQYDAAIEQYRTALDKEPNFWVARLFLGHAFAQQRRYDEAIVELERARQLPGGNLEAWASLGHVYGVAGKTKEARQILSEFRDLQKQRYIPPNYFAIIHAGLGEKEQALAELEKGFEERNFFIALLHVEPMFDGLKSEPRFQKLVADMKFPPK